MSQKDYLKYSIIMRRKSECEKYVLEKNCKGWEMGNVTLPVETTRQYCTGFSPSQPQPDSASASPCAWISYLECIHVCFTYAVSLVKTIINYCYWQSDWILFHSRNIHKNALAEAEPDTSGILWFSLSQNMKCLYFMNETISSQIASSNS